MTLDETRKIWLDLETYLLFFCGMHRRGEENCIFIGDMMIWEGKVYNSILSDKKSSAFRDNQSGNLRSSGTYQVGIEVWKMIGYPMGKGT